ncbi:MAG: hypothetical protein R2849_10490 [Thermomicrobiales bacterium]
MEGGFIVRATPTGSRNNETLEFVDQQFPQLLASAAAVRETANVPARTRTVCFRPDTRTSSGNWPSA